MLLLTAAGGGVLGNKAGPGNNKGYEMGFLKENSDCPLVRVVQAD